MFYDATVHPLLSPDALRLPYETIREMNECAEDLLGLSGSDYTGTDADRAARAVALQINHQVALGPEAFVFTSTTRGGRSWSYRGTGTPPLINPAAASILAAIVVTTTETTWVSSRVATIFGW